MELSYSASDQRIYSETDPRLFEQGQHIVINKSDKKIESPGKTWTWYNSWHVTRRQPGVFKTAEGRGPYTLTNSFDYHDFEELTWAHYSFYVFRGPIRESYDCNISEIEDKIWKELKQSARIIRIDKLDKDFYVKNSALGIYCGKFLPVMQKILKRISGKDRPLFFRQYSPV